MGNRAFIVLFKDCPDDREDQFYIDGLRTGFNHWYGDDTLSDGHIMSITRSRSDHVHNVIPSPEPLTTFGVNEAIVAINNVNNKYEGLLNPAHEYVLKQAIEALGKMHDGGLT